MSLVKTLATLKLANRLNEVLKACDASVYVSERDADLFRPLCDPAQASPEGKTWELGVYRGTRIESRCWVPNGTFTYGNTNYQIPQDILEALRDEEFSEATQEALGSVKPELVGGLDLLSPMSPEAEPELADYEHIPFPEEAPKPKPYDGPIIEERIAFDIHDIQAHGQNTGWNTAAAQADKDSPEAPDADTAEGFMEELEASQTMEPDKFEAYMEEKFPLRLQDKTWEYDEIIEDMAEAMEGTEYVEDKDLQVPNLFGNSTVSPFIEWEELRHLAGESEPELLDLKSLITPVVVDVAPEDPQGYVPTFNHVAQYVNAPDDMDEIADCCGSCARSGTRVVLLDGTTKDVEDLEPGDEVASYYSGEADEDPTWIEHLRDQADINEWIIGNVIPEGIEIKTADDLTILDCFRVTAAFALKRV